MQSGSRFFSQDAPIYTTSKYKQPLAGVVKAFSVKWHKTRRNHRIPNIMIMRCRHAGEPTPHVECAHGEGVAYGNEAY